MAVRRRSAAAQRRGVRRMKGGSAAAVRRALRRPTAAVRVLERWLRCGNERRDGGGGVEPGSEKRERRRE
ncbi:hypothetical protein Scep_014329 [Stephania cephalantha]|uniref:Uncharacterized protein n=1 Tax=Stephania cephalantha TaxID=152367 RepID=A0AAP0P095_9MAGN